MKSNYKQSDNSMWVLGIMLLGLLLPAILLGILPPEWEWIAETIFAIEIFVGVFGWAALWENSDTDKKHFFYR